MTESAPVDTLQQDIADLHRLLDHELRAALALPPAADTAAPAAWLAAVRGRQTGMRHPRLALFCCETWAESAEFQALQTGEAPLAKMAEAINTDLQVHEVPVIAAGAPAHIMQAVVYGMTAVQPGLDLLGLSLSPEGDAAAFPAPGLDALLVSGRGDLAALCGAAMAARLARVPVTGAGKGFAYAMDLLKDAAGHMRAAEGLMTGETDGDETGGGETPAQRTAVAMAYLKSLAALAA
jgi:hypothetical protein